MPANNTVTSEEAQRQQVQTALNPQRMGEYLTQALGSSRSAHECRILDTKYEPGHYCTILYLLDGQLLIGSLRWDEAAGELPVTGHVIVPLEMQVYRFDHDPALPGLRLALDSRAFAVALSAALPECQQGKAQVIHCRATPLRYRPGKRCTLRVDLWLRDSAGERRRRTLFGKVYHDADKAAAVYAEMHMLAGALPVREGRLVLAAPVAFLHEPRIVLQNPVAGTPLELYLEGLQGAVTAGDQRGWQGVVGSAAAFAALHTAGLATPRERPIESELKRFVKRAGQAAGVNGELGAALSKLAAALPLWAARLDEWGATISLVHGDCKPSQIMLGPAGVAILDFDHCGMADPATDIGTYLATLRQLGRGQLLRDRGSAPAQARCRWLRELELAFLDAYCSASGVGPEFRLRATWYEAAALLRKALRGFARSPRATLPAALVEEGWRCLGELPAA